MKAPQKLWKKFFVSSKKLFFCNFSSYFPLFLDSKGQIEVDQFMMSWIGLHKFEGIIFGITQKHFYITPSNLVR